MTGWDRLRRPADSLLDTVGVTPLVRLARVSPSVEVFAKIEWFGPTGSMRACSARPNGGASSVRG
jgi:cysteine synthase